MRLKEPLYGIRVAQLHPLAHLTMIISQIVWFFHDPKASDNGGVGGNDVVLWTSDEETEAKPNLEIDNMYYVVFFAHILCFVFQLLGRKFQKDPGFLGIFTHWLQNIIACYLYFSVILYFIYYSKLWYGWNSYIEDDTQYAWASLEIEFFFNWLFATGLYLVYQYFFRFQSTFTRDYDHTCMFKLKDSMDFLRYTEFELSMWNMCVYPIIEMISRMTWKKAETFETYDYILAGFTMFLGLMTVAKFIYASRCDGEQPNILNIIFMVIYVLVYIGFVVIFFYKANDQADSENGRMTVRF